MRLFNEVLTVGLVGVVMVAGPVRVASAGQQAVTGGTEGVTRVVNQLALTPLLAAQLDPCAR